MKNFGYVILSRDELVKIIQSGSLSLPTFSRIVPNINSDRLILKNDIEYKLAQLNVLYSNDYVLAQFEYYSLSLPPEISISIFDLVSIFCLDESSRLSFQRSHPRISFSIIDFPIEINSVIKQVNHSKILTIMSDCFGIDLDRNKLQRQKIKDEKKSELELLASFKREALIEDDNNALLNDIITMGFLLSDNSGKAEKEYRASSNIAGKYIKQLFGEQESLIKKSQSAFPTYIDAVKGILDNCEVVSGNTPKTNGLKKNDESSNTGLSIILLKLFYLKFRHSIRTSSDDTVLGDLLELYNSFSDRKYCQSELELALEFFLMDLEYSDLYKSLYNYKQLRIYNEASVVKCSFDFTDNVKVDNVFETENYELKEKVDSLKAQLENYKENNKSLEAKLTTVSTDVTSNELERLNSLSALVLDNKNIKNYDVTTLKSISSILGISVGSSMRKGDLQKVILDNTKSMNCSKPLE